MAKKTCAKCGRTMEDLNFYTFKNGDKHDLCKSCLTMHIDNFNPETFLYILQQFDVPYIPTAWNNIRDKAYAKNPKKMSGMSVLGKYLSLMKLNNYNKFTWADSQKLQERDKKNMAQSEQELKAREQVLQQQYQRGQISEQQYRTLTSVAFQKQHEKIDVPLANPFDDPIGHNNNFLEEDYISEEEMPNLGAEMTLEEKQEMALKWGRTYKISDWFYLQQKYVQMMNSFDIHDADSKNTLIFICKTLLKMDQAINIGDVDGYQKLSRVYDSLRKSMHVTAAQNKQNRKDFVDSVGQLVAYCQKNGGAIPRYQIKIPYDKVDIIIEDLKGYTKNLIYQDSSLARQIQNYIKYAKATLEKKKDKEEAKRLGLDTPEVSDDDIANFKEFIKEQKDKDSEIYDSEVDGK